MRRFSELSNETAGEHFTDYVTDHPDAPANTCELARFGWPGGRDQLRLSDRHTIQAARRT